MTKHLRIAVADDELDMREYLQRFLPRLGHEVVAAVENGRQLVEACHELGPDLVITDIKMPEVDGIEAAASIFRDRPTPVILVSAFHDPELIERAEQDHVMAYLVKPIKLADLETAIAITMRRYEQFQSLRREATDLRQALEDRKIIERAKGVLMKKLKLDEHDAFRRLQKISNERNLKLVDVANTLLLSEQILGERPG
jgi:AmiR/NasT family two-component response regulator